MLSQVILVIVSERCVIGCHGSRFQGGCESGIQPAGRVDETDEDGVVDDVIFGIHCFLDEQDAFSCVAKLASALRGPVTPRKAVLK